MCAALCRVKRARQVEAVGPRAPARARGAKGAQARQREQASLSSGGGGKRGAPRSDTRSQAALLSGGLSRGLPAPRARGGRTPAQLCGLSLERGGSAMASTRARAAADVPEGRVTRSQAAQQPAPGGKRGGADDDVAKVRAAATPAVWAQFWRFGGLRAAAPPEPAAARTAHRSSQPARGARPCAARTAQRPARRSACAEFPTLGRLCAAAAAVALPAPRSARPCAT